jgi:hypothetical protein
MNRRELLQAMLTAPVVALMPSLIRADPIRYSDPIRGTFIWVGGINETCVREQDSFTYTYDADVAVGICEGPVQGIRRIWADDLGRAICIYDKRPRQADETNAQYRDRQAFTDEIEKRLTVYLGTETQSPSPLIESREGTGTPAYRGLHYVTLEQFPIEPFGNRVPEFWFETCAYPTENRRG